MTSISSETSRCGWAMEGMDTPFIEFSATKLYSPSYLSSGYVLYENNVLTEVPAGFTLMTRNKRYSISN